MLAVVILCDLCQMALDNGELMANLRINIINGGIGNLGVDEKVS